MAERKRRTSAKKEAKKQVFEKWSKVLKEEKPTTNQLLMTCFELLEVSAFDPRASRSVYLPHPSKLAGENQVPKWGNSGKEIAELVAHFVEAGVPLTQARKSVAELLHRTEAAVKQADLRHRKARRDKPR